MTRENFEKINNNVFVDYYEELEEDVKEACEKQVAEKPSSIYGTWSGDNYFKFANNMVVHQCPDCDSSVRKGENYCCNCGKKLDWSE